LSSFYPFRGRILSPLGDVTNQSFFLNSFLTPLRGL
jgi:hypothetical protein